MTSRTALPASTETFARQFVDAAYKIIAREANGTAAHLRLDKVLGGPWQLWALADEPQLLAQQRTSIGRAQAIDDAARDLVRASLARLAVADAAWLVRRMRDTGEERQPGHFRIVIDVEGEAWQLRVGAHHSGGGACTVAELAGVVEQPDLAGASPPPRERAEA